MEEGYLLSRVVGTAPAEEEEWMEGVVAKALQAKAASGDGAGFEFKLLGPKALDDRVGPGLNWSEFKDGRERRLKGHTRAVCAVRGAGLQRVCGWVDSGWRMSGEAADLERSLVPEGDRDAVHSLSSWGGRLISGHGSGRLRVWNVVTGACDQVLEGHTRAVCAIVFTVCGSRLASGSADT
jgi:WD40 repeat protein